MAVKCSAGRFIVVFLLRAYLCVRERFERTLSSLVSSYLEQKRIIVCEAIHMVGLIPVSPVFAYGRFQASAFAPHLPAGFWAPFEIRGPQTH